ncbi:MAG TPA: hypothetical protein DDX71_08090 [Ruminococcus sp.]|nr:hypothetical protein [Ruminococcus sp.]
MGLLGKLFGKKQQEAAAPPPSQPGFETPLGSFHYSSSPACNEYGYEADIPWYLPGTGRSDEPLSVFIDTDSPESIDAGLCCEKLERIYADRIRVDFELKKQVADFFLFRPDTVERDITEEKLIEDMELCWMAVRRDGSTEFSLHSCFILPGEIMVIYKADGSKEVRYRDPQNEDAEVCFPL